MLVGRNDVTVLAGGETVVHLLDQGVGVVPGQHNELGQGVWQTVLMKIIII